VGKVPGGEVAGIVEKVGKNVKRIKKGDRVFGITADILGAWAEYACADELMVYTKPSNISFEEGAGGSSDGCMQYPECRIGPQHGSRKTGN
jgi:NADPH:quinone reductase-like Zn-dependent oxidoreductase